MHQMSKPRRPHKGEDPNGTYWYEDQERLDRLYDYCKQDVEVERELFERLPPLSPSEQALWVLSSQINERGFYVDRVFAEAARRIAQAAAPEIDAELAELTGGAVTGINQVARLLNGCSSATMPGKALTGRRSSGSSRKKTYRRRCGGYSSFGSVVPKLPSRRSRHCLLVPATMIVFAVPFGFTAHPLAAGPVKDFSRRI